jgi:hypothetical protein
MARINISQILMKRGNTTAANTYVGPLGELVVDTGLRTVRVQDGVTAGGMSTLATNVQLQALGTYANATFGTSSYGNANVALHLLTSSIIGNINANVTAANAAITSLTSNAAIQASILDTLTGNAASQSTLLDTLTSNAATQATSLSTLLSNAVTQQTSLTDLVANAAAQAQAIANAAGTYGNANVVAYLPTYTGNIAGNIVKSGYTWTFSNTGTTTFPTGVRLSNARGANTVNFTTDIDKSFQIETQTSTTSRLWSFGTDGNLTLPQFANINFSNGVNILSTVGATYGNTQVAAYLPTYTGNIAGNIVKNGNVWTFGTNGTTTFPTNISIDYSGNNVQFPRIIADSGKAFSVQAQGNIGSAALSWTVDPDAAGQYAAVAVTKGGGDNLAKVLLSAQSDSGDAATAKTWVFNQTGTTRFPGDTILAPAGVSITMQSDQYSQLMWENANVTVAPNMAINSNFYVAQNNATLDIGYRDGSSTQLIKSWYWNVDGGMSFPDTTTQYTAFSNAAVATYLANYDGGINFTASPAVITGLGNISSVNFTFANGVNILSTVTDLYANAAVQSANIATINNTLTSTNVAIGYGAGQTSQGGTTVAIGAFAGMTTQGLSAVAIGFNAGQTSQGTKSVAIGMTSGYSLQGNYAVAIGDSAGYTNQGAQAIAIGRFAGLTNQANNSIILNATGANLNATTANTLTVAPVRNDVANIAQVMFYNTTSKEVTYGNTISVAGNITAGNISTRAITLTNGAVIKDNSGFGVAFGEYAGTIAQGAYAVAILGGYDTQGADAIAIGQAAGSQQQGTRAVAIGRNAGQNNQGDYAISIGWSAGVNNQPARTIILNGSGSAVGGIAAQTDSFYVAPVRNDVANVGQVMFYNTTSKEVTYGNVISVAGNINAAQYNFANGVNILSTVGAGAYGNTQVASYLLHFDGDIEFTSSTAKIGNVDVITVMDHIRSPAYQFSNGTSIFDGITSGGGTTYTNANVVSLLAANSSVFIGNTNNVNTYSLQSNITQVFIGGNAAIASGNANVTNSTSLLHNMYFAANGTRLVRNTGAGVGTLSFDPTGFTVSGLVAVQTANSAPALPHWIKANASGLFAPSGFTTSTMTASGTVAANGTTGIQTSQTTFPLVNQTATTILFGGAATSISMGSATIGGSGSNVFVGNAIGTSTGNLTVRAFGTYNSVNSLNSSGGYATTTYSNIAVTGGSGTGMIISMSGAASGYLASATVTNPGTGYRNGETITIPAGNPVGSLGGSFVIGNYNAAYLGQVLADYSFGIDGNLTLPGNVTIASVGSIRYANGVNYASTITGTYSNTNVASYLTTATITTTGNITAGNLTATGTFTVANITTTGTYGNITGANVISANTVSATNYQFANGVNILSTVSAGSTYSNANVVANLANYVSNIVSTANVTAAYFIGNGSALTGITANNTGNIYGTSSNVTLVAGSYSWKFDNTGNLTLPGNTFAVNYANTTPVNVVTRFESTWTVPTGNSTQSFTVGAGETYYMWVDCNIPNGIIAWNATATVTNTNVPVVGAQYAWVYTGNGTPIDFTSIPNQFVGTANTIVRSTTAPSGTTNRFDFGLNNTSGGNVTVRYGWIAIS